MTTLQEFIESLPEAEQVAVRKRTAELIGKVSSGHPELDEAVAKYIAMRQTATEAYDRLKGDDPRQAYEEWLRIETAAWEAFYPIKVKYWQLDHPDQSSP